MLSSLQEGTSLEGKNTDFQMMSYFLEPPWAQYVTRADEYMWALFQY